jgi:hypothetical protein
LNAGKFRNLQARKKRGMRYHFRSWPMTGFLGTVVGDDSSFHKMAQFGQIKLALFPKDLHCYDNHSGCLVVGIIAYVGYNHLVKKQNKIVSSDGSQCS